MHKKRRQEEPLQAMTSTSCDSHASMPISLPMTTYYSSDSTDGKTTYSTNSSASGDEWQSSSSARPSVISNKACTKSTKKISPYRLSQAMLDCRAEQLNVPDAKRHHTTFYRHSMKLQKTLFTGNNVKLRNALFHQLCFDEKKIFEKRKISSSFTLLYW